METLPCRGRLCEHPHGTQMYLCIFCPFGEVCPQTTFPHTSLSPIFHHVPSKSLTVQPNHWPQPVTQFIITQSSHCFFQSKRTSRCMA